MEFEPIWGLPIALYLFLAGLGAGAFVASVVVNRLAGQAAGVVRAGRAIAIAAVAVGLVLLMVDAKGGLLHPQRFVLLLNNPFSVMSWGVVFLAGFVVIVGATLVLDLMKRRVPFALEIVGCAFAFAVAAYTGVLLGVVKTFPLWNSSILPFLFVVSALSTGICSVLLFARLARFSQMANLALLERVHRWLGWAEALLAIALLFFTALSSEAGQASVLSLIAGPWAVAFWLGFVALALVVPIALHLVEGCLEKVGESGFRASRVRGIASDAATIVGGFMLRYLVVMAALPVVLM